MIIEANPAAHQLFQRSPEELHKTSVFHYLVDEYGFPLESVIGRTIKEFGSILDREVYVKWGEGEEDRTHCCMTVYPLIDKDEAGERRIYRVVGTFRDLSERDRLVTRDKLTGLLNKHGFSERLEEYLRLSRRKGWPLALVYLDLNGFKAVNDTCDHYEGDRALEKFAARFQSAAYDTDIYGRQHGDEFSLLLIRPEHKSLEKIAHNLVEATRFSIDLHDKEGRLRVFDISAAIGICWREGPGIPEDPELFLKLADRAMSRCKHSSPRPDFVIDANGTHKP
jgi:diguanylate cyclase (GGDEF)-like protein